MKNVKFESEIKRNDVKGVKLIWGDSNSDSEEYYLFRKAIMCDKLPKSAILNIFVQSEYKLYVNGEEVAQSGAGTGECAKTDEIDVLAYLKSGKNVIAIMAHYIPYQISTVALRKKGLLFNLKLGYTGARNETIVSDSSVLCSPCEAFLKDAPRLSDAKTTCEIFDNNLYDDDWMQIDYDDTYWKNASQTDVAETEYFAIEKSEFKCVKKHVHSAKAIIAAGTGDDVKGLPLAETFYSELPKCILNKLYVVGTECEIQPMDKGQHSYILVDFERLCSGYVKLDINGYGSDMVDVIFAKELDSGVPVINGAARFILKPENNILETNFDKNEFKYVLLVFRNPVRTNVVKGIWVVENEYPFENTSSFTSNNDELNAIFEKSSRFIKSKFTKNISYIGLYEKNTIFAQRIAAVSNCYLTGEILHFKELLKEFALMQTENGKVINKTAPKLNVDFYDMFAFALALKDYVGLSSDEQFAENTCEKLIKMMKWISQYENNGFLKNVPDRFKSDALLNLYYIYTLDAMAEICAISGNRQGAKFFDSKANKLKKAFISEFIQDEQTFFADNKLIEWDLRALLMLTLKVDFPENLENIGKINMPLEFIRAAKKSENNKMLVEMLIGDKLPLDVTPALIAENILGINLTGKKGIKSSADTENFENIEAEICTPKGVVAVSVKNKVIEKNTLSVNINQADGEL